MFGLSDMIGCPGLKRVTCRCAAVALLTVLVAGCSGNTREVLGLDRTAPDEFTVITRAPLALPPSYNIRPPAPGMPRPQEQTAEQRARGALTGGRGDGRTLLTDLDQAPVRELSSADRTEGEVALLRAAGADRAADNIRRILDEESLALAQSEESFTNRLLFWREAGDPSAVVVDAAREADRIRNNRALGEPITQGEVPVIERRERALLEGVF